MKYVYPAVFTKEGNLYSVNFPDLQSCYTSGEGLANAFEMAEDVLSFTLYFLEKDNKPVPYASDIKSVACDGDSFVNLIHCDTDDYRRLKDNKAIKKTLTIPTWLNYEAEKHNINFSQILQDGLRRELNV